MKSLLVLSFLISSSLVCGNSSNSFLSSITRHVSPKTEINDPYYTGEKRVGEYNEKELLSPIGDLEKAWLEATGKGITVAVIDTGIDINHLDFQNNISDKSASFTSTYEIPGDILSNSETEIKVGKEYLFHEDSDHGTTVSGVIAAEKNQSGIVGIAYDATILALKIDLEEASLCEAIKYAVDNDAKVINISLGGYAAPYIDGETGEKHSKLGEDYYIGEDTVFIESLDYAYDHDVVVVAAAGNECTSESSYPASNNHVIGVGALKYNSNTEIANYSNFNKDEYSEGNYPNVDIVAPGNLISTKESNDNNQDACKVTSGTSFASPVIAGAAALYFEKYKDATVDDFEDKLYMSAADLGEEGFDKTFGNGLLDINALLEDQEETITIEVEEEISLFVGDTYALKPTIITTLVDYNVFFSSSNQEVATIDSTGRLIAIKEGETIITIKVNDAIATTKVIAKNKEEGNKKGCGGNISFTSISLCSTSLIFIFLLLIKRKFN